MKSMSGNFSFNLLFLFTGLVLIFSICAIGCGGSDSGGESDYYAPPQLTSVLRGQIIDRSTGAAIPDAVIILENGFIDYVAMTDGQGKYSFDGVETGSYRLTAGKTGFITANTSVVISQGLEQYSSLVLEPYVSTGTLVGTVVRYVSDSSTPDPLENVEVEFPNLSTTYVTDSLGSFVAPDLPSGMNIFILRRAGFREQRVLVDIRSDTTVYRVFEMLDISGVLEGCVRGVPSMNPLTGILVSIDPLEITTITGVDGCYSLADVTSGIWPVTFQAQSYTPTEVVTDVVDGRTTVLDVDMRYGFGTVAGVVSNSISGVPVGGVTISMPVSGLTSTTNAFGEYSFDSIVRTGSFVPIGSTHSSYVSSGTYISLGPMENVTVDFSILPRFGSLSGVVRSSGGGVPIIGASLTIVPLGATTSSDAAGHYSFANVLPGFTPVTVSATGYETITTSVVTSAGTSVVADLYVNPVP